MMVLNSSLDPAVSLELLALTGGAHLAIMHMDGREDGPDVVLLHMPRRERAPH